MYLFIVTILSQKQCYSLGFYNIVKEYPMPNIPRFVKFILVSMIYRKIISSDNMLLLFVEVYVNFYLLTYREKKRKIIYTCSSKFYNLFLS